ncbi:hypothetical protein ACFYUJ_38960 [Streptomyces sp. NPDC004520]|uniref:hypothetical protein n=1 Tax=Streptomyces sp. NPDC004520 TaxID=3364702 RepID=UPI0036818AC9
MTVFTYAVQTSQDQGRTWTTGRIGAAGPDWIREGADTLDPAHVASDVLDKEYREHLEGDGAEPVPLLQVLVWDQPVAQGAPTATSSTGTDSQWQATGDLIEEIAADIRHFEVEWETEKKRHEAAAASTQTAIANAKARLARVVNSAARMQMPQVSIAHRAGRSREWVRQITS